ncbi:Rieske 2Fe-2S domain-containing protein [Kocuria palustris]|uniref:Rieske 2Fe-2S domain-containing protein n=1 Tax=Kocuria palustris TaxID=71999 RepID=UPI0011A44D09|nr:Rieske 2Fe-2S domain-containing protein [Kocuria palustris]
MTRIRLVETAALPQPGAFVTLRPSGMPLLVTRDADGFHVLVNTCPHQQSTVCRESSGTAETFECPSHYWTFEPDGTFTGSRLALAAGREAPRDPAKDLERVAHEIVDGWIEIEDPAQWRMWDPIG